MPVLPAFRSALRRYGVAATLLLCSSAAPALAQQEGEYRTAGSGNWGNTDTWEIFQSGQWNPVPPASEGGEPPNAETTAPVTIREGHTVDISQDVSEYLSGDLNIENGAALAGASGTLVFRGPRLTNNGTIQDWVDLYFDGASQSMAGSGTWVTASIQIGTTEPSSTEVRLENDVEVSPDRAGLTIRSGADLLLSGNTLRFSADHSINIRGTGVLSGGQVETTGSATILGTAQFFDADLTVDSGHTLSQMIHTGSLMVDAGATFESDNAEARGNVVVNGTLQQVLGKLTYFRFAGPNLVNNGVIADVELQMARSGPQNLDGSGEWRPRRLLIQPEATVRLARDLAFDSDLRIEEGGLMDLAGRTLTHQGGSETSDTNVLNNFGSISGQGQMKTTGWILQHSPGPMAAPLLIESGKTRTSAGPVNYGANVTVAAGAELEINTNSGSPASIAGSLTVEGTLSVSDFHNLVAQGNISVGADGVVTGGPTGSVMFHGETFTISDTDVRVQTIYFQGDGPQRISGAGSFWNIVLDNVAGLSLDGDVGIGGELRLSNGDLFLGTSTVDLGETGFLREQQTAERANRAFGSFGLIKATRNLTSAVSGLNFSGIGVTLSASKALGTTTIIRGHSPVIPNGIARYFDIAAENNADLNASLTLSYHEAEMSGVAESDELKLYREGPNGWERMEESIASSSDDTAPVRSVGMSGIAQFSRWTIGGEHLRTHTRANLPNAGDSEDPVNTLTGELFFHEASDLALGGPLSLAFRRYYASFMDEPSPLGLRWSHNFNWRLQQLDEDSVVVVTWLGRRIPFAREGSAWMQAGMKSTPYQLAENGTSFVLGDVRTRLIYEFDAQGRLARIEDGRENAHVLSYSGGRISEVADGLGRSLHFTYDGSGRLTELTDGSRTVQFGYDGDVLASATDALGRTTTYAYDDVHAAAGLMTARTRPRGNAPFTQTFDEFGRVATQSDAGGNSSTFTYGAMEGRITDPLGGTLTHAYDEAGRLVSITDEAGNTTTFTYDAVGHRSSITNREGEITSFDYHEASGLRTSVTLPDGAEISTALIPQTISGLTFYLPSQLTYPDGSTRTYEYDASGNLATLRDTNGNTWTFTYNDRGQVVTASNPLGGVTTLTYNADGTPAQKTNPSDATTEYAYDELRRRVTTTRPDGSSFRVAYDDADQVTTVTDERGSTTTYGYDANGELASLTFADGAVAQIEYDGNDRPVQFVDPAGASIDVGYDVRGAITSVTDRRGRATHFTYDERGFQEQITDPAGRTWTNEHDAEGRIVSVTDPLGNAHTRAYDARGHLSTLVSPLGHSTSLEYGADGLLAAATNPLGHVTRLQHGARGFLSEVDLPNETDASYSTNALGLIDRVTDPNGYDWERTYDEAGRLQVLRDPLGRETTYQYDARGRPSTVVLPDGSTIVLSYDAGDHTTQEQYGGDVVLDFAYDAHGRMTRAGSVQAGYDASGRLTAAGGFSGTRDADGRLTAVTYPGGKTVSYGYDDRGLLVQVQDWVGGLTQFEYDAARRLVATSRPNGLTTNYEYDADGRLIRIEETDGEHAVAYHELDRDAAGNLVRATRHGVVVPALEPDSREASVDAAMQLDGAVYDALGRLIEDDDRTYEWDAASRLVGYSEGGTTVRFTYDALGARRTRTDQDGTRSYDWNYLLERPAAGIEHADAARYYVHTPAGELLHRIDADSSRHFFHFDERGNTVLITDEQGEPEAGYAYTPYGRLAGSTGELQNAFTFGGRYGVMQEGALYQMHHRFYDGETRRFLSPDPARYDPSNQFDPISLNPYQYAFLNPMRYVDPMGQRPGDVSDGDGSPLPLSLPGVTSFFSYVQGKKLPDQVAKVVEAARDHRLGGRLDEAAKAHAHADDLAGFAKKVEWAGHGATLLGAAITAAELSERLDAINVEAERQRNRLADWARNAGEEVVKSRKQGYISQEMAVRLLGEIDRRRKEQFEQIESNRSRLFRLEAWRGAALMAENLLPNPTSVSITDHIIGPAAAWVFGD